MMILFLNCYQFVQVTGSASVQVPASVSGQVPGSESAAYFIQLKLHVIPKETTNQTEIIDQVTAMGKKESFLSDYSH